ncbi:TMV resistance protein N-like [Gossypium hirsutum]|uniref:TMV resistance protein N-like n=1 Tax=Gossypium hirsutum TaxID=3635 RepID=A0ABM3AZS7_GOSHI|nr:TMV resistance protein N-like [Gossypium hirsutum]
MLASTSSSSAAAADMIKARTYDVFLSFRGEDTRDGFVSHLYKDLRRKNIETFIDSEKLPRGDEISEALLTAIEGARVSVIVFSKDVDPSDVRKQRGSVADAFSKHEANLKHDVEKVKSWRSALTSAANLSGWNSQVTRVDPSDVRKQRGSVADAFSKHEANLKHDVEKVKSWRSALTSAANLSGWNSQVTRRSILETFLKRLRDIDLNGTTLKELPTSVENLIGLMELRLYNCENLVCLPDNFYKLKSLHHLHLYSCSNRVVKNLFSAIAVASLTGRPEMQKDLHGLSSLKTLDLSGTNIENLPTTIKQPPWLEELILWKCKRLKSLPELPPSLGHLDAHDCTSLEEVSSIKKLFEQALLCKD